MTRRRHFPLPVATKTPPRPSPVDKPIRRGSSQPHACPPATIPSFAGRQWLVAAALLIAVLLAYQPAWYGGIVWDDEAHVTRPELRSWHGLYRIWFEPGATPQYYPLVCSAFWAEHRLWGDATLGYHLVNLVLHWVSAILLASVLRRLAVPGAFLAAAIFALHPVHVESVAWITEQKNTLSGVFYLTSMLFYLGFDRERKPTWYCAALGLFLLALLSKTTTVTLPAALLVVFWWQRGTLSWRRDVGPLTPFFLLAAAAGLFTRWAEYNLVGAGRAEFTLSTVQRCLLGGRAICFYLSKLFWPAELVFIYPRWRIDASVWWQYLFPAAVVLLVAGLWAVRRRWRGPLAAVLFFVGTLFPVLGFFNVFFYAFSFVSDHFLYLPSLGIIALASAGTARLLGHWGLWRRPAGYAVCLTLLATLTGLTWRQSRTYIDYETLFRTTIGANPDCLLAQNNLGLRLLERERFDEAIVCFRKALEIGGDYCGLAHYNLALALAARGNREEAIAHYRKVLQVRPDYAEAHYNLGLALAGLGNLDGAMACFRKALKLNPRDAKAHKGLGAALASRGRLHEATTHYRKALKIDPDNAELHYHLGLLLRAQCKVDDAIAEYQESLRLRPDQAGILKNLAWIRATCPDPRFRDGAQAVAGARRAVELSRSEVHSMDTLAAAYAEAGRFPEALAAAQGPATG